MEHDQFDDLSRVLVTRDTRRGAVGALAGLLGLEVARATAGNGKSPRKRRERRRKKHERRRARRASGTIWRPIKLTVVNPSDSPEPQTIEVELGFGTKGSEFGRCCQGQAGYRLTPGQIQPYTTEENAAYIWIDNKYFIYFLNPGIGRPHISWAYMGATGNINASCCKPRGEELGFEYDMEEGQQKVLNFHGRNILVARNHDQPTHKSFDIVLA